MSKFSPTTMAAMSGGRILGEKPGSAPASSAQEQAAAVASVNVGRTVAGKLGKVDDRVSSLISLPMALIIAGVVYAYMRWGE